MKKINKQWWELAQNGIIEEVKQDKIAVKEIELLISVMIAEIEKEILSFYTKYASYEGIDVKEAKKKVDKFDVESFKNKAKKYVKDKDFSEKANKELKKYNTKMYVSREELLKDQLNSLIDYFTAETEKHLSEYMGQAVRREVARQAGILGENVVITPQKVTSIVNADFGNTTWSKRLWDNMDDLRKDVQRIVSHVTLRGRHPNEFVSELRKKHDASVSDAKRLLITETARAQTLAQKEYYLKMLGDDSEYKFVAKKDEKTSKTCLSHNGNIYKVKEMTPGLNAPPMHPNCRSSTVPVITSKRQEFINSRKGRYSGAKVTLK
ncbi:TPA: minor capsid protein [Staphylococcus aureus]|nr:minor capsid protein [Staphylococcus aureus]